MKKLVSLSTALALVAFAALQVAAETEVNISGQVRLRTEVDGKTFDGSKTTESFGLLRTRVNVDAVVDGNAHGFVQFQDSRTLGGADHLGEWQSGNLNDGKNVDLHQAYIQIDRVWFDGFGLKGGRFELNMGNQRVFGAVGWSNVGRTWEGGMGWYQGENFKLSGFWLKAEEEAESSAALANRDFDIFGAQLKIDNANLELFGVYELDNDTLYRAFDSTVLVGNKLDRLTFGLHYHRQHNQLDFELNGAYQIGNMADTVDVAAFMFTGEVGYNFGGDKKVRIAAGVDFTSGDDNPSDTDHKAYNNLYYTGHKFRGHMDYFVNSGDYGLMDIMLRTKVSLHPNWTVKGDFHYFKTASEFLDPANDSATTDVGMEFDFSVATSSIAGVKLVSGVSIFLPQEPFVRLTLDDPATTESDPTVWAYGQTIIDF